MRKNSKLVGALIVGRRCVLFLSIETKSPSIFPLNQTTGLTYSPFFCPNYSHIAQAYTPY